MKKDQTHIYAAENAQHLDRSFRKILEQPYKLLKDYISDGMTVLELGAGNGFYTIPLSRLVGRTGNVIAVDIQEKMLILLNEKVQKQQIKNIKTVQCSNDSLPVDVQVDFILAAYVIHEVTDQKHWLKILHSRLKKNKYLLIKEPKFIVSKTRFLIMQQHLENLGFQVVKTSNKPLTRSILVKKVADDQ